MCDRNLVAMEELNSNEPTDHCPFYSVAIMNLCYFGVPHEKVTSTSEKMIMKA